MALTLRHIRYFIATAESGKVTQAAADLSVSQSSVTTAVRELEEHLGVSLFNRRSNGVRLTLDGHRFIHHAHHILAAVAEAERSSQRRTALVSGRLRVWVSYTVAGYFLAPLLSRFKISCPGVDLALVQAERPEIEKALVDGDADIGVMLVSNLRQKNIAAQTLIRSPRKLWLASSHPLLRLPKVSLKEVANEPYIMLSVDEAEATTSRYWRRAKLKPDVFFATTALEAVRGMVAAGLGVTILADIVYRPWSLEGGRIEVRELVEDIPSLDIGLAWSPHRPMAAPTEAFREFLEMSCRGDSLAFPLEMP